MSLYVAFIKNNDAAHYMYTHTHLHMVKLQLHIAFKGRKFEFGEISEN